MDNIPDDIAELTYEQARDELVRIVAALESGSVALDESLTLWERGEALAARCQQVLDGARERIIDVQGASATATEPGSTQPESTESDQ